MQASVSGFNESFRISLLIAIWACLPGASAVQAASPDTPNPVIEQQRQQERTGILRQQQERGADVRSGFAPPVDPARLPEGEQPCFVFDRLELKGEGADVFGWLLASAAGPKGDDQPLGRCLGSQGINLVLKRMRNALIARGYITSQVGAEAQDLKSGTLVLNLYLGRIHSIRFAGEGEAPTSLRAAIPARPGDILNLRDIEQGLENFKYVPSADADIKIEPAVVPGQSDLVIDYRKSFPLRGTLTADDSGTKATGKYQGNAILAYDNPLGFNDLAYLSLGSDLGGQGGGRGTEAIIAHYSVPFGYWKAGITASSNKYRQTVAGAFENYVYRGTDQNAELRLSRLVYRDARRKTTLSLAAFQRSSRNYINDTEVEVQHRAVGGWSAAVNHREFIGNASLDATLGHKHGTGAFGAITAPEEAFGEGTSRFQITSGEMNLDLPFALSGQKFLYRGNWRSQWNHTRLTPQDMFIIGGRYSVRGFDGEMVLAAERGWFLRNEVAMPLGATGLEGYVGADYGQVSGPSSDRLLGKSLSGAVVGVRGNIRKVGYDFFAGAPIHKPDGFRTAGTTFGFRLNYGF